MRVDLIITELDVGGAEKCFVDIAVFLKRRLHQVRVIALGQTPTKDRDGLHRRLLENGIEPIYLDARGIQNIFRVRSQLRKLVGARPPQVALSFLFHANFLASNVYSSFGIPLVVGVRVADRSRVRAWLSKSVYRKCSRIVCVSQSVAEHICSFEGADRAKVSVIDNGIDFEKVRVQLDEPHPALLFNKLQRQPFLLFVGRYEKQKQIEWLLALLEDPTFQQSGYRLVTIGDGSQKYLLTEAASKHPHKLLDVGRQSDVLPWMASSQLLLLPSRYEGMPNVLLEAMACGIAIAATPVEGVKELLGEAASQQASEACEQHAWLKVVGQLMSDAKLRAALGERNRLRAQSHFPLFSRMEAYEKLLIECGRVEKP